MRSFLVHTFLVTCSLLLCFLAGEGLLRFLKANEAKPALSLEEQLEKSRLAQPIAISGSTTVAGLIEKSPFEDVVYELKPNLRATFQGKPLQTNSAGFRDREYPLEKPPGVFRVIGIGDSVMFGWGVSEEESYLSLIEAELEKLQPGKYEFINAAVPGYNTAMEVALLERKLQFFNPDLVVLHFVGNDLGVPLFMTRRGASESDSGSYLLDFLKERFAALISPQREENELMGNVEALPKNERHLVQRQYRYMVGQRGFRRAFARLAHVAKERRIPIVVITGSKRQSVPTIAAKSGFIYASVTPFVERYVAANMQDADQAQRRKALWVSPTDFPSQSIGAPTVRRGAS